MFYLIAIPTPYQGIVEEKLICWALQELFPSLGAVVNLNPQSLITAVCVVGKHTVIFGAVTIVLYMMRIPGQQFVSALQIWGAGDNLFMVSFYGLNPETGAGCWPFLHHRLRLMVHLRC
jgi:hypothetical protein